MATLQMSEYESVQQTVQGDIVHIVQVPPLAVQALFYTPGTPIEMAGVFKKSTRILVLATDDTNDANVSFGKEGLENAEAKHDRIPADAVRFFGINPEVVDRLNVS